MIVYDLECQHCAFRFEAWFGSARAYDEQRAQSLVACPTCNSAEIAKAPMRPNLGSTTPVGQSTSEVALSETSGEGKMARLRQIMAEAASLQSEMLKQSTWVGPKFAEEARAIHYGETESRAIHGEVDGKEAKALIDEGVAVAPLPFPVVPPKQQN